MISRSTLYSSPGGDTTQIEKSAKYLRASGVEIEICLSNQIINYDHYDLVHFFNIIRPDDILPHIKKLKVPFIISTIFVDYLEFEKKSRNGILGILCNFLNRDQIEYLKAITRSFKNGEKIKSRVYLLKGHKKSVRYLAQKAALLLPNSNNEYKRFSNSYGVEQRYCKIVNAIDTSMFNIKVKPDLRFNGHVLCVGRIERLKNQLNLIKALIDTNLKLTIIGKSAPNHFDYFEECKYIASKSKNVLILDYINHNELPPIYKAAKVHVLPSWFETTGLSSMEAGAMGCNLVITNKGDTEEYFGDMVYYCEPDNINSIREAVLKAYKAPINPNLKDFIFKHYTWERTAEQTLNAYKSVLTF